MTYLFLAEGFEETEAIVTLDLLRRAGVDARSVGIGAKTVTGAHGIPVEADLSEEEVRPETAELLVLPGGMPGALNLEASETVQRALSCAVENGSYIGAICAAPLILGHRGLLRGKRAVCYPGFEKELTGALTGDGLVCADGKIVTARGPGAAVEFALLLAEKLCGREKSQTVRRSL